MRCRHCEAENSDLSRFCDTCGTSLQQSCGACGAVARIGARFCGQCGTRLQATEPQAQPFAPPALFRQIDEGERKLVTVLFADIRGSTSLIESMDPEQAMGVLDPAVQAMVEAVQRFGGTVNRVQGDGIMALFGAPIASEDHAARACLAGQAIVQGVAALHAELEVRVGLNSGDVVIRSVGKDPSDYDAVGVTVHLAHRMESTAQPGTVCLTGRTALLAHGAVELESLGSRAIAGIAEPVQVFRLIAAQERAAWDIRAAAQTMTRFVGREPELRLLEVALGRAGLGRGQAIMLSADAGLGKSRLVHEFLKRMPQGGWKLISAAGISHAEGTPYRLAAEILRAWLVVDRRDGRADVARKLAQALLLLGLADAPEAAPLQSLLDLPVTDPGWGELSAERRRERMVPALRQVMLREAAIRPLLLLIEDLHWTDPQSEELLDSLVDGIGGAQLLLLVTTRPIRRAGWSAHAERSYATVLRLGPLEAGAAETLLAELLGRGAELAELRARIIAQADGTPLFIEELSRALIEQGVVVVEPSSLRLTRSMTEVQIPASVQAILANRIDQLQAEPRRLLQLAAVIGRDIPREPLAAVADLSDQALAANLTILQAAEFLYEVSRAAGADYTFKHALTQAVAYESMLRRQRRELHGRVLVVMEALASDRADELTELLADHALRGEVWDRAASLTARAGARANARSAWHEAIRFYEQALSCLARQPERPDNLALGIDVRLGLRVALAPILQITRVLQMIEEASVLAEKLGDLNRISQVGISRCLFLSQQGNLDVAVDAGSRAQDIARTLGDSPSLLSAAFALGQTHWFRGDFAAARLVMEECLPLARGPLRLHNIGTTGTGSVLLLVALSKTHAIIGDFTAAFALATEAKSIAVETRKPYDITYASVAAGFAHLQRGDAADAVVALEQALDSGRVAGISVFIPSIARYLGRAYALTGRLAEAHRLMAEAIAVATASDMVMLIAWCGLAAGHAHAEDGNYAEAVARLQSSIRLARMHGYRPAEALGLRLLAETKLSEGDLATAQSLLADSAALATALGMAPELTRIRTLRGRFAADTDL